VRQDYRSAIVLRMESELAVVRLARKANGFTLIELGIAVGVIAILATVVLIGRGFVAKSKVGKGVECLSAARLGAANYIGAVGGNISSATDITTSLRDRSLIPTRCGPGVSIAQVFAVNDQVALVVNCKDEANNPDDNVCADIFAGAAKDPNFITSEPQIIPNTRCATADGGSDGAVACFNLY
jgi:prepilin-type N-terminal cleavage/methylation domain-containing protein